MGFPEGGGGGGIPGFSYAAGQAYPDVGYFGGNTINPANGIVTGAPFMVGEAHTFTAISCVISTAGTTGAVVRMGVYADNGAGKPGSLITDAGTAAATTAVQVTVTASMALPAGPCWLVLVTQGAPTTVPSYLCSDIPGSAVVGNPWGVRVATTTTVTGALPATFPASTFTGSAGSGAPLLLLIA